MTEPTVIEHVEDAEFTPVTSGQPFRPDDATPVLHTEQAVGGVLAVRDPAEMIAQATVIANQLKDIVAKAGLVSRIGGKEYLNVEAWTTLGVLVGCTARTEWTHPVEGGWEAAVEVINSQGTVIGRAEAQCMRAENNWKNRDDYAIRSMAQTRAMGKALRMPLGWIAVLAGYTPTPAEEMPPEPQPRPSQSAPEPQPAAKLPVQQAADAQITGERMANDRQIVRLNVLLGKCYTRELFTEDAYRAQLQKDYGVTSAKQLTSKNISQLMDRLSIVLGEQQSPA